MKLSIPLGHLTRAVGSVNDVRTAVCQALNIPEPPVTFTLERTSYYNPAEGIRISLRRMDYFKNGFHEPMIHELAHYIDYNEHGSTKENGKHHGPRFQKCLAIVVETARAHGFSYAAMREYKSIARRLAADNLNNETARILGLTS